MAAPTFSYFAELTKQAEEALETIGFKRLHFNPDRSIWEVHGTFGQYNVRLKEIFNQSGRMYSYYAIERGEVAFGFDNYPDRRALRKKYSTDFRAHTGELIPHKHGVQKTDLELTEDMTVDKFLNYLLDLAR